MADITNQSLHFEQALPVDRYWNERYSLFAVPATEGETNFPIPDTTLSASLTPQVKPANSAIQARTASLALACVISYNPHDDPADQR